MNDPPVEGRPRVGFVGNRYGSLSFRIFVGASEAASKLGLGLLLIDSSLAREAAWTRRARNRIVRLAKRGLGVGPTTEAGDWFRRGEARGVPHRTPPEHRLNYTGFAESLASHGVEALLIAGCDQILRSPFLERIPRVVNFHNSLLPEYRGVNAVEWAFLRGERVSGYTFHTIESERIDLGRIVVQRRIPIEPADTPSSYTAKLLEDASGACADVLRVVTGPTWPPEGPVLSGGSYFGRKEMAAVRRFDPGLSAEELVRRARVLDGLDLIAGRAELRLSHLEVADDSLRGCEPGRWRIDGASLLVRCRDGGVRIRRIDHLPAALSAFRLPRAIPSVPEPA